MDPFTQLTLDRAFLVRIKDAEHLFVNKKYVPFTVVERWVNKAKSIKDDRGKQVLKELLECLRRLH